MAAMINTRFCRSTANCSSCFAPLSKGT